jgi:tRNA(Ile)-lysidine synthase
MLIENIPWLKSARRELRFLVGVSGGADSVALLHLLVESGFRELVVCHLNHGLRGEASAADARFVQDLAEQLGLICEMGIADVNRRMKDDGESLETAARQARHEFFALCAEKYRTSKILLAHHADDQAETVLWNLLRGSHGMKGMGEAKSIATRAGVSLQLIRPLLGLRRAELREWLTARGLSWREDASNFEPIGIRNRLRNEVFRALAEISGRDAVAAFARAAADAAERDAFEAWALDQAKVLDPQGRLHLGVLRSLPIVLQRAALWNFLRDQGISGVDRPLIDCGLRLMDVGNPASINLPGGGKLKRREGRILVET